MTWTPTKPLSPEEVAKLRVPSGSVPTTIWNGGIAPDSWHFSLRGLSSVDMQLAGIASSVANGVLPPIVLDLAWAAVEGRIQYAVGDADREEMCFHETLGEALDDAQDFDEGETISAIVELPGKTKWDGEKMVLEVDR